MLDIYVIVWLSFFCRVRQRESEEEEKNRVELQQKMQALLSLKNNIEGNRVRFVDFHFYFTLRDLHINIT